MELPTQVTPFLLLQNFSYDLVDDLADGGDATQIRSNHSFSKRISSIMAISLSAASR